MVDTSSLCSQRISDFSADLFEAMPGHDMPGRTSIVPPFMSTSLQVMIVCVFEFGDGALEV